MKTKYQVLLLALHLTMLLSRCFAGSPELLPGVQFYDGPEPLTGKLVFLLGSKPLSANQSEHSATIYEFDLQQKALRKVTPAPGGGVFIPSKDGKVFCVRYLTDNYAARTETNIFVYSDVTHKGNLVFVPSAPRSTVIVGQTLVVELQDGKDVRLLTRDIHNQTGKVIHIPEAPKMEYNKYHQAHAAEGKTNVLHFEYRGYGDRYDNRTENLNGYYALDLVTGAISFVSKDDAVECNRYRTFDGKYVFFSGRDSPFHGFALVKSPVNHRIAKLDDPRGKNLKTLASFSVVRAISGAVYTFEQVSPCRRYAFVSLAEPLTATKSGVPGWAHSYYIVDVVSGKTRLLIKENVKKVTSGFISEIWWVGN